MSFDEFIKKYDGHTVDWDNAFGGQCVDLYRLYVHEVLNLPQSKPIPGAKDIWDNFLTDSFDKIPNTPTGVPTKGDIVIWGSKYGKFGHVAIFTEGDAKKFKCFSQNDPIGTKCHVQAYPSYTGVLGWLRAKDLKPLPELPSWLKGLLQENQIDPASPEGRIREMFDQSKKYEAAQKDRDRALRDLAEARGDATKFEELHINGVNENRRLTAEIEDLRKARTEADVQVSALQARVEALEGQLNPDKVIVVTRDEYAVLVAKDQIKAASRWQLFKAILAKTLRRG